MFKMLLFTSTYLLILAKTYSFQPFLSMFPIR